MKDKILNVLMLAAVAGALIVTLVKGAPTDAGGAARLPLTAVSTAAPAATPHPVDAYRARRAESRRQDQALLRSMIESPLTPGETRALAEKQCAQMASCDEMELAVEAVLAARGWGQALCVARSGSMTILLSQPLSARDAALILEWAAEVSGLKKENIRISVC